ncbi:hypothetical protein ACSTEA_23930, partial [Vibrio vulnificus]
LWRSACPFEACRSLEMVAVMSSLSTPAHPLFFFTRRRAWFKFAEELICSISGVGVTKTRPPFYADHACHSS